MPRPAHRPLSIDTAADERTFIVSLSGNFDAVTLPDFSRALRHVLASGVREVVVDLTGLATIDRSGMAALLGLDERLEHSGRRLLLMPGGPSIQRSLDACGLLQILTLVDG